MSPCLCAHVRVCVVCILGRVENHTTRIALVGLRVHVPVCIEC